MVRIGGRLVGDGAPTFVIAEAGSNHNGDIGVAKELIDVAAEAGADAVKFQTFRADRMYVEDSGRADYLDDDRSIYEIIKDMEMPYEWIPELHDYCRDNGVLFMSTAFDEESADELEDYVPAYKVASYTMSHEPFLEYLCSKEKPVLMSTGAHSMEEVRRSVEVLKGSGVQDLILLQCVAAYPTPLESINVRVVETLREEFGPPTGLSDHTIDPVTAPCAAVSVGADVVEKHFTLDRGMEGPDHEFALEPSELRRMVDSIRKTEEALGNPRKEILDIERDLHDVARRRIHATEDIQKGEELTEENIGVLRSGNEENGLEPKHFEEVLGLKARHEISKNSGVTWDDVEE